MIVKWCRRMNLNVCFLPLATALMAVFCRFISFCPHRKKEAHTSFSQVMARQKNVKVSNVSGWRWWVLFVLGVTGWVGAAYLMVSPHYSRDDRNLGWWLMQQTFTYFKNVLFGEMNLFPLRKATNDCHDCHTLRIPLSDGILSFLFMYVSMHSCSPPVLFVSMSFL